MSTSMTNGVYEDVNLKTTCYGCPAGTCGMIARRVNGVVVSLRGDPDCPFSQGKLCAKGQAQIMMAYSTRRVTKPLKRTNPEKGVGVDPAWVEISYEEAVSIAAEKLKQCRQTDPTGMVYSTVDFPTLPWFLGSVLSSFGSPNFAGGGVVFCGNNVHPILQQVHGGFHASPDFHYGKYVMLMGSSKGALGNWAAVTAALEMSRAHKRGMKLVVVDPVCSNAAAVADEWVPIRPGTDGALVLSMMNVLINELGLYDAEFLRKLSNGPYLIRDRDGRYVRDGETDKPLIWDEKSKGAKCYDDPSLIAPALEGHFEVGGEACTPAFALLKRHLTDYPPERAAEITTVPAETIRRLAEEFGTAASIGQTVEIDGETLPLRAACAHWYKGISQHSQGFEQGMAIAMLNTIVGAIDVPGGLRADTVYAHHPEFSEYSAWMGRGSGLQEQDGLVVPGAAASYGGTFLSPFSRQDVKPPASIAADSLAAVGSYMGSPLAKINVLDPKKFNSAIPHNTQIYVQVVGNDMVNEGNPKIQAKFLKKFAFHLSIVPNVDETAEFADIVIPTQTQLERLDMGANNIPDTMGSTATEEYCINLRQPVVESDNKHHVDVWIDIAAQAGFLTDLNRMMNTFLELRGEFQLKPEEKYTHRQLTERWIRSMTGGKMSLEDVAREGRIKWAKSVKERYPRPFYAARIPIYYEYYLTAGEQVKAVTESLGFKWDVERYKPLPGWYPAPGHVDRDNGFELYSVVYKQAFKTATFSNFNPWLAELGQYNERAGKIVLNRKLAQSMGIKEGDRIRVENRRGRVLEGVAHLSECIHPECVGMDHNGGNWAKSLPPRRKGTDTGVHVGTLLDYELKNLDLMDGALEASPKVRVSRIGGGPTQ